MRKLLDFLSRYNYWFVFLILEIFSLTLLFRFNHYQGSVWFTSANRMAGTVLEWQSNVVSFLDLRENNRALVAKNTMLEQENACLQHLLEKMDPQKTYTERLTDSLLRPFTLLEATVVRNSVMSHDNYITINRGSLDGVLPEMGVVGGTGVVGIVYLTAPHYSIVMPVLNSKSNISCRLHQGGYFGYLNWEGGNPLYAWLNDVPRYAKVKVGDVVETSGYSSVFPPGIFVGRVKEIGDSDDGLSYRIKVHLGTDFGKLRNVNVLISSNKEELDQLDAALKEQNRK